MGFLLNHRQLLESLGLGLLALAVGMALGQAGDAAGDGFGYRPVIAHGAAATTFGDRTRAARTDPIGGDDAHAIQTKFEYARGGIGTKPGADLAHRSPGVKLACGAAASRGQRGCAAGHARRQCRQCRGGACFWAVTTRRRARARASSTPHPGSQAQRCTQNRTRCAARSRAGAKCGAQTDYI